MAMTILQIVQQVCLRLAITSPNAVITSVDPQILQLLAISNEEGQSLAERYSWTALQKEVTFTTVAAQLQGLVETIAPGYKFIINDVMWNRTTRLPIYGSQSAQDWQRAVSMNFTSPYYKYRIKGASLYFFPIPTVGQTVALEYESKNWVNTSIGGTSNFWSNDADTCVWNDEIMMAGLMWRWKAEKGLDYSENFITYERLVANAIGRDGSKPMLSSCGGDGYSYPPAVVVSSGSWPV